MTLILAISDDGTTSKVIPTFLFIFLRPVKLRPSGTQFLIVVESASWADPVFVSITHVLLELIAGQGTALFALGFMLGMSLSHGTGWTYLIAAG